MRHFMSSFLRRIARLIDQNRFGRDLAEEVETHRLLKQAELERLCHAARERCPTPNWAERRKSYPRFAPLTL
jgi:hypothetical protein